MLCGVTFVWLSFLQNLSFSTNPPKLIPLECFPIPFPLLICFVLTRALYTAFFFSLNSSGLIINGSTFHAWLAIMPEVSWLISSPMLSPSDFLPFLLKIKIHRFNWNFCNPPQTRYLQSVICSPLSREAHRVSFYLSLYSGYYSMTGNCQAVNYQVH